MFPPPVQAFVLSQPIQERSTSFWSRRVSLSNRAGDTLATDPPPSSPAPPDNHNGIPKIGGSSAGFIALVVSLAAIVLVSCITVFVLLRTHKPDPYERHARRVLAGTRESNIYEVPLGPPGMRQKFKKWFSFGKGRKSEGWVRANSRDDVDEWDASDDHRSAYSQARELSDRDVQMASHPFPTMEQPSYTSSPPSRPHIERSMTSDSVELFPNLSPPLGADTTVPPHTSYTDPFVTSPTSTESPERSRDSSPSPNPPHEGRFSVQSGDSVGHTRSMRKFSSGTKFKEVLDF